MLNEETLHYEERYIAIGCCVKDIFGNPIPELHWYLDSELNQSVFAFADYFYEDAEGCAKRCEDIQRKPYKANTRYVPMKVWVCVRNDDSIPVYPPKFIPADKRMRTQFRDMCAQRVSENGMINLMNVYGGTFD